MSHVIRLQTKRRDEILDITAQVDGPLALKHAQEGLVIVCSPHTTAGITINKNADPDVQIDILRKALGDLHLEFAWRRPPH